MSSEDSHGDAAVVDGHDCDESTAAPTQIMTSSVSSVPGVQTNPQWAAASTLLQLHDGTLSNTADVDTVNPSDTPRSRLSPTMLNGTGDERGCGSMTWGNQSYASRSAAGLPGSTNMVHDPFIYSQPNMQNTILGLANAIGSLQQGQINIQQEHESIHTRQENNKYTWAGLVHIAES